MRFRPITLLVALFAAALGGGLAIHGHRLIEVMRSRLNHDSLKQIPLSAHLEEATRNTFQIKDIVTDIGFFRYAVLNERDSERVISGSDGFMFYRAEKRSDGHVIDELRGEIPYSPQALEMISRELRRRSSAVRAINGHLLTVIVPNKESIFSDLLPRRFQPTGKLTRLDQLVGELSGMDDIDILDLRAAMRVARASSAIPIYFHTDSHWNQWGKYCGYRAIVAHIAQRFPTLHPVIINPDQVRIEIMPGIGKTDSGFIQGELLRTHPQREWFSPDAGLESVIDLNRPVHSMKPKDEISAANFTPQIGGNLTPWSITPCQKSTVDNPDIDGHLIVLHDSFGVYPLGFLAEHFKTSTFYWSHFFDTAEIQRQKPLLVVQIVIERYLDVLGSPLARGP